MKCGRKWILKIVDLSRSLKSRYTLFFKLWYLWMLHFFGDFNMVAYDMVYLFLSKGNYGPDCVHAAFEHWPKRAAVYWWMGGQVCWFCSPGKGDPNRHNFPLGSWYHTREQFMGGSLAEPWISLFKDSQQFCPIGQKK